MIKNAIIFEAELPSIADMEKFIEQHGLVVKPLMQQIESFGFRIHPVTGVSVSSFMTGYCLTFTHYRKKIDMKAISHMVNGMNLQTKQEKSDVKDSLIMEAIRTTLPSPTDVFLYYDIASKTIVVDTTQEKLAEMCISHLRKVFGSLVVIPVQVDSRNVLSEKLCDYLSGESKEFIERFQIGESVELVGRGGSKCSFKNVGLACDSTAEEIITSINESLMMVKSLEMTRDNVTFTLTGGFKFKNFKFDFTTSHGVKADGDWETDSYLAISHITHIAKMLCEAFDNVAE